MVGVTAILIQESQAFLLERLHETKTPRIKERLQVLYWLKQENAPTVSAIALSLGKHRNTVQKWLAKYREGGLEAMLEIKKSPGGVRVIPQWAESALAQRLQEEEQGFQSYGEVQQWLEQTLGIEAEYHTVYQMTRQRLKAKLKGFRPQNRRPNREPQEVFNKNVAEFPFLACREGMDSNPVIN